MRPCRTNWPKMTKPKKTTRKQKVEVQDFKTEIFFFLIKREIMEMTLIKYSMLEIILLLMVSILKDWDPPILEID